ncbi:hypothetical protein J1N35_019562 [Gossypium stocksii]|uniref:Uncharacterized protein n=1 Tax=Gossypium stocksii TaxID=47602 RepID=A0A9D4A875_9ROSI|nr:hypothetical protein J1N35_019562 [Gossypium stocksii]
MLQTHHSSKERPITRSHEHPDIWPSRASRYMVLASFPIIALRSIPIGWNSACRHTTALMSVPYMALGELPDMARLNFLLYGYLELHD